MLDRDDLGEEGEEEGRWEVEDSRGTVGPGLGTLGGLQLDDRVQVLPEGTLEMDADIQACLAPWSTHSACGVSGQVIGAAACADMSAARQATCSTGIAVGTQVAARIKSIALLCIRWTRTNLCTRTFRVWLSGAYVQGKVDMILGLLDQTGRKVNPGFRGKLEAFLRHATILQASTVTEPPGRD